MAEERQRLVEQDADLNQTNDQKVDQGNTQDASHKSNARQDLAVHGRQTQVDEQRVTVTVQNHLTPVVAGTGAPAAGWTGQLVGRVVDLTGAAIADCVIEVFFGPRLGVPVAVEESDHLGRFHVAHLPPGFYSLHAVAPDGTEAEHWNLRVDAGGQCRAHLCLPVLNRPTLRPSQRLHGAVPSP